MHFQDGRAPRRPHSLPGARRHRGRRRRGRRAALAGGRGRVGGLPGGRRAARVQRKALRRPHAAVGGRGQRRDGWVCVGERQHQPFAHLDVRAQLKAARHVLGQSAGPCSRSRPRRCPCPLPTPACAAPSLRARGSPTSPRWAPPLWTRSASSLRRVALGRGGGRHTPPLPAATAPRCCCARTHLHSAGELAPCAPCPPARQSRAPARRRSSARWARRSRTTAGGAWRAATARCPTRWLP